MSMALCQLTWLALHMYWFVSSNADNSNTHHTSTASLTRTHSYICCESPNDIWLATMFHSVVMHLGQRTLHNKSCVHAATIVALFSGTACMCAPSGVAWREPDTHKVVFSATIAKNVPWLKFCWVADQHTLLNSARRLIRHQHIICSDKIFELVQCWKNVEKI